MSQSFKYERDGYTFHVKPHPHRTDSFMFVCEAPDGAALAIPFKNEHLFSIPKEAEDRLIDVLEYRKNGERNENSQIS